jgi:tetratricopeptide (TPR) repeat protein
MKHRLGVPLLILLLAAMPGCAKLWTHEPLDYHTVSVDPSHDYEKAKKENEKALKFVEGGKLDKAEQALQRSLVADVNYGPAHNNLGKLYYSQSKYYLAAIEFDFAIKLMPERAEPANNLGMVYEKVGKLNEAIESYEVAQRLQPTNPEVLGNLIRAHMRRGDPFADVEKPLNDLVYYDTRPEWVDWAKHQLALSHKSASSSPSMEPIPTPRGERQVQPTDEIRFPDGDSFPQPPETPRKDDNDRVTRRPSTTIDVK